VCRRCSVGWFCSDSGLCKNLCSMVWSTWVFGYQLSSWSSANSGDSSSLLSLWFKTHSLVERCASRRLWGDKRHSERILVIICDRRICLTSSALFISRFALSSFFNFDRVSDLNSALQSTFEARAKQAGSWRICWLSKYWVIRIISALETF
jgi:hypothetical protein